MPADGCIEHWRNELAARCESASRFIVERYKSDPTLNPLQLWDEYLHERYPTSPYGHLAQGERESARLEDIKELALWAETVRTPAEQVPAVPGLQEQVSKFGVLQLVPKQVFLALAESDLRPSLGTRVFVHQPSAVARQYAAVICGETFNPAPTVPELTTKKSSADSVSRTPAPPPPRELSGRGWVPTAPKPERPTDFPPYYPQSLRVKTGVILADTVREFQGRWTLEQFCRKIVSNLTNLLCDAVSEGTLTPHAVPDRLDELLHYVRVSNCKSDHEIYRVKKAVINSDEWHAMLKRLAECEDAEAHVPQSADSVSNATTNRERIDIFIEKLRDAGHSITRTDIWRVAGYQDATEFERFQREDDRTTSGSKAKFSRVLAMSPEAFMERRKKHPAD